MVLDRPIPWLLPAKIDGWTEQNLVIRGGSSFNEQPFAIGGGDCLFDTGSLFCFAGAEDTGSDNVLMVLWGFPSALQEDISGNGQLNSPPSAGSLVNEPITWQITLVN